MICIHCGAPNRANYLDCANCNLRRVAVPPAGQDALPGSAGFAQQHAPPRAALQDGIPPEPAAAQVLPDPPSGQNARFAREITRYLCAAVWTDKKVNARLLDEILNEPRRAVASSPGVDLVMVLRHAFAAYRRRFATDLFLVIMILFIAAISVTLMVSTSIRASISRALLIDLIPQLVVLVILVVTLMVAGGAVFLENLKVHRVLTRSLRRNIFDPAAVPARFRPGIERRLAEIQAQDHGNVTVFPAYSPFFGHGSMLTAWSFVLNVAKPATDMSITPFSVEDVYGYVAEQVRSLGPGVAVENRVLVNGDDLLQGIDPFVEKALLPYDLAAPVPAVDDRLVRHLMFDPQGRARTYLSIRVIGWSGELVLTVFLRFTMPRQRELLFVEASYLLLTPVQARYRVVDKLLPYLTVAELVQLAAAAAAQAPGRIFTGIRTVLGAVLGPMRGRAADRREIEEIRRYRSFNYGARVSARELVGDKVYFRYFQELDTEMYSGTVERRIFDAITDFLEAHGVDVAELAERTTTILNNGIYVSGEGTVSAQSIAAGQGSLAHAVGSAPKSNTADGR